RRIAEPDAALGAYGQRNRQAAAGHLGITRRVVDELVEGDAEEVDVHDLDDGTKAARRRPDRRARNGRLGNGRVADTIAAVLVEESLAALEQIAPHGDVF